MINANLLCHYWQTGPLTAADAYADAISSLRTNDLIAAALVNEFKLEREFARDSAAMKQLERKLKKASDQKAAEKGARTRLPKGILVADVVVTECIPEWNCLPLASATLLKQNLERESNGRMLAIRRPEILEVKKRMNMTRDMSANPAHLLKIAKALAADMVTFGEIAMYEGTYLLNLRVGEVSSGEIIAVTSERFASIEELPNAIQKSAKELIKKIEAQSVGG
jgi:hypothetical protein